MFGPNLIGSRTSKMCDNFFGSISNRLLLEGSARAGEAFHHEAGAASRHMRDDGGAAMDFGDHAQIDGKGELHRGAFFQS